MTIGRRTKRDQGDLEVTLPTEAEWEYAARADVEGQPYLIGDEWAVATPGFAPMAIACELDSVYFTFY